MKHFIQFLFFFVFLFLQSTNGQAPGQGKWNGQWIGGGSALGIQGGYDTTRFGISGHAIKDFQQPGANVGIEGRLKHSLGPNTDAYISAHRNQNIGPIPKNPSHGVGIGIIHRF